jgi:hypothetical protein
MENLSRIEKDDLKQRLQIKIDAFIDNLPVDNHLGWMPDDTVGLMTDAAFAVLMAIQNTNVYMDEQELLK